MTFDAGVLEALAEAVRKAAQPRTWSRGVVLAREEAVEGVEENDDEIVLAVRTKDRPVPPTVVLYPETEEWDCDCGGRLAVCPHVAAAVIALTQARKDGAETLPESKRPRATVRYLFRRQGNLLELERRSVEPDGASAVISEEIRRAAGRRQGGTELVLAAADLELDRFLASGRTLIDRREQAQLLFERLAQATDVWLGDQKVTVEPKVLLPKGRITRRGDKLSFRVDKNPLVEEVVAPDIARVGNSLQLLGEVGFTGSKLEKLPYERTFRRSEWAILMQEVLPIFEGRFPIDGKESLPTSRRKGRPRLDFEVVLGEQTVNVTAAVVYGEPPTMRIEDGRPVYLGGTAPERNFEAEHRLVEAVRGELNLIPGRPVTVRGPEGAGFLQKVRAFEASRGRGLAEEDLPVLVPHLEVEEDGRFHLSFAAEGGEDDETEGGTALASSALSAFSSGHSLVPLVGGGWARLSQDWWSKHADDVALLLHLRDSDGRVPAFGLASLGRIAEDLDAPAPPGLERLAPLFRDFQGLPKALLPPDLQADLRPYQVEGVDWLSFLKTSELGGVLADDMGLGKTLQTICVLEGRSLVVCPTSVIGNWAREIERFRPGLRVYVHHGPSRAMDPEADVVLTTYALLRRDRAELSEEPWSVAVLDEAQAIKNPDSLTARAAFSLKAKFRVALTGTPVENRLSELWSQLHYTNPGLLGGRSDFDDRFAKPIEGGSLEAQGKLRARTKPFVLRRMKKTVAKDLPPRTDMILHVELDEAERAAYDSVLAATRKEVAERLEAQGGVLAILEALLRLRQAACHTALLPGKSAATSSKLEVLGDVLEEAVSEGHKALVFSQWTSFLDLTEPMLEACRIPFIRLDGSTPDRQAVVEAFQDESGPPVMLLSLKAGGTGLNLTAADHVFLLDPWWNPAAEDQAADRAHRIGQDRPVIVHRLVARDTVEERILDLQDKKRKLAEAAVGEGAGAAAAITKDELMALLDPT